MVCEEVREEVLLFGFDGSRGGAGAEQACRYDAVTFPFFGWPRFMTCILVEELYFWYTVKSS